MFKSLLGNKYVLPAAALAVAVFYQLFCIIHGFDLTDEGFLYSLYQYFGDDINACKGGAGYPLTCFIGWLCYLIFPTGGILWLRLCGVVLVTFTAILSFLMLRKICPQAILLPALLIQVFVVCSDPKPLGYNTLTAIFALLVIVFSVRGMESGRPALFVPAGLLAALSFYLRLPNVAFASFILLPFCGGFAKQTFKQALAFGLAYIAGIVAGWALMAAIGADVLILDFFNSLFATLGGESTHSSGSMLKTMFGNYMMAVVFLLVFLAVAVAISRNMKKGIAILVSLASAWLFYFIFYLNCGVLAEKQTALLNGIGLGGCIYLFITRPEMRPVSTGAVLMSVLCPFGSDKGFTTVWTGTWILFPLGLYGLYDALDAKLPGFYKRAFAVLLATLCLSAFLKTEKRAYYDGGTKLEKQYIINGKYSRGVLTTELRASVINGLLSQLRANGVEEGDTILVYSSSPMIYFLTGTKPFAGVSWPCLQFGDQYVETFKKAAANGPKPRIIVLQNFDGLGSGREWGNPDNDIMSPDKGWAMATAKMNRAVISYIEANSYKCLWTNGYYDVFSCQ